MSENINPVEYLEKVLVTWNEFCKQHSNFVEALRDVLEENKRLKEELNTCREDKSKYKSFFDYFSGLYGQGLEVANWHLNGELESFDNFFDSSVEMMQKVEKNRQFIDE